MEPLVIQGLGSDDVSPACEYCPQFPAGPAGAGNDDGWTTGAFIILQ